MTLRIRAREKMAAVLGHEVDAIVDEAELTSLVNSSFKLVELVIELQEEFDVRFTQTDINTIVTVGQLLDLLENRSSEAVN